MIRISGGLAPSFPVLLDVSDRLSPESHQADCRRFG
jgi:hypothetical protein